jgi:hypothetical protein
MGKGDGLIATWRAIASTDNGRNACIRINRIASVIGRASERMARAHGRGGVGAQHRGLLRRAREET